MLGMGSARAMCWSSSRGAGAARGPTDTIKMEFNKTNKNTTNKQKYYKSELLNKQRVD
jgi:hypothetical protein